MKRLIAIIGLVFASAIVFAYPDHQSDIVASMKAVWEKPDNPLIVKPVIIVDNFAIAGWLQGDKGGRALLKKGQHGWQTLLCAGEISSTLLNQAGVPSTTAKQLLTQQAAAEKSLSHNVVTQLSSFMGVVKMDGSGNHHGHPARASAATTSQHSH